MMMIALFGKVTNSYTFQKACTPYINAYIVHPYMMAFYALYFKIGSPFLIMAICVHFTLLSLLLLLVTISFGSTPLRRDSTHKL